MNEPKISIPIYITPDGSEVVIPADLAAKTKFTKDGMPDRRLKANADFVAWADAQDQMVAARESQFDAIKAEVINAWAEKSAIPDEFARRRAKAYALRVWNGQSSGLPRAERIDRVRKALESQGMSMEGIEL